MVSKTAACLVAKRISGLGCLKKKKGPLQLQRRKKKKKRLEHAITTVP